MATTKNPPQNQQSEAELSQESAEQSRATTGANAAMAAVQPQQSQIRGSFMPGGGAGEDATTLVDPDTKAQFPAGTPDKERDAIIAQARADAQAAYERDRDDPGVELAVVPAGVDTTNPNSTVVAE